MPSLDNYGFDFSNMPPEMMEARALARRQKLAEAMMQQSQQPLEAPVVKGRFNVPISPLAGLGKLAQAYFSGQQMRDTDKQYAALGDKYRTNVADAMANYQTTKAGTPGRAPVLDPQESEQMADQGTPMPENVGAVKGDPRKAITEAMMSPYLAKNPMIAAELAQLNKPPEKLDLGDRWKVTYPDGRVVLEPKAATPDATMRRDTTLTTHATPSGSAALSNQGAMDRHATPSGNTILTERGAERRHATPSGSAVLGANTTLQTHATPSGSARLSADTARRGQDQAVDPVIQGRLAEAREAGQTTGAARATAAITLPQATAKAEMASGLIDQMIGGLQVESGKLVNKGASKPHAGFSGVVGAGTPGMRFVDGTKEASFAALLDQVKGGAFLQAFESLKGGGAITEMEGKKASDAITRMSKSQSEAEFVQAAREFQTNLNLGMQLARQRAGATATTPAAPRVVDW